jgi:hypothetical protein
MSLKRSPGGGGAHAIGSYGLGCAWVAELRTGGPLLTLAVRILACIYAVGVELKGIPNRLLISGPQVRSLHGPPFFNKL